MEMNALASVAQPLFCRSFGNGPRQVLALHCTIAHSGAWRGLADLMTEEATFHATDMLFHGRSPDWDGEGDFHDRMTAAVAEHLVEGMDLIGHSFGATLALRLAAENPEKIRSLTLVESVHAAFALAEDPNALAEDAAAGAPFHEALEAEDFELAARIFNRGWGDGPGWENMPEARRAAMVRGVRIVPHCGPAIYHDRPGLLRPGALDGVTMPVLLLRGAETQPMVTAVHEALALRLPQARNVVVGGAGHMLPLSHPVETAVELRQLFSES